MLRFHLSLISRSYYRINQHEKEAPMKKKMIINFIACLITSVLFNAGPSELQAEDVFITIGGGDFSGVYFPTGLAIADMINNRRHDYGTRATVGATTGSTFNLNAIMAGYLEFGLVQSDIQYQAVTGLANWAKKGPQKELRAVFSIYPESVTLVAAVDAGINTIVDLKGKRVSLGNPTSSQHRIIIDALEAAGLDPKRDISPQTATASNAPALLQDNRIDAYFFTVGHPSETIRRALSNERKARIIPISGPDIDKLVADNRYYIKTLIEMQRLYTGLEGPLDDVDTFGVVATLCTSSKVPEEVVYAVTKVVFENLDGFRRQHPALVDLTKGGMLEGLSAPLHPGAIKYFREVGLMQ
jgi:TRAP transporter TAXI family solute receptor